MSHISHASSRLKALKLIFLLVWGVFLGRLFVLQVIEHDTFAAEAKAQHEKRSVLPARRGKILIKKNRLSSEYTPLATNNTLKMLFVDPLVLAYPKYNPNLPLDTQEKGDPVAAAAILAPLLIHGHCEAVDGCDIETDVAKLSDEERFAVQAYQKELTKLFLQQERTRVLLETEVAPSRLLEIETMSLPGIWTEGTSVFANPTEILDINATQQKLKPLLNIEPETLKVWLSRRPNRYAVIMRKIVPEVTQEIEKLKTEERYRDMLRGIQLRDEHWRYYPEKRLAAQVVGFVDSQGNGQYGVEGYFNHELQGREGYIMGATNTRGQRILGDGLGIERAQDGADIKLTIDRVIQGAIEKILEEDTQRFQADSGQVIVIEPKTGKILAMAQAPSFNPNEFGKVYQRYEITNDQEVADREDEFFNQRIPTVQHEGLFYRYFNTWGPEVFRNKIVSDIYEPGSVMKAITMAAALNADEVKPKTTYDDKGPIEVEGFTIRNADAVYAGPTSMISIINRSLNTGIAFLTQKMGAELMYKYLRDFGVAQYTDIPLSGEAEGDLEFWKDWAESELITRGFGQGVTTSPLQMAMAFSVLANGGYLMKPMIIESIEHNTGELEVFSPEVIRRVISEQTYHTTKSMLLNSVNNGVARGAQVKGYEVMGKTGTSQTYRNGKALEGEGTTIATFAGFGPFQDPKFVILVKYDYPKISQWGSETAAPTFGRIAKYLFQYFEVPPAS